MTEATVNAAEVPGGLGLERDCQHGQLARACDRCADSAEIAELRERVRLLELAEEGAKEAFGHVVQQKRAAEAKCKKLEGQLAAAYEQIRVLHGRTPETRSAPR